MTPNEVSGLMAKMVGRLTTERPTINDPCCGSGRLLISMAKHYPDALYVGQDIDERCVKMSAINAWLFDLNADLILGDTLRNENRMIISTRKGGYIFQTFPESVRPESHIENEPKQYCHPGQTEFNMD